MSSLSNFLRRNSIPVADSLPLVHTTQSYYLKHILGAGQLTPRPCDTFIGEQLNYFFVGRPAYKKSIPHEAQYWELPCCLVFDYDAVNAKRIFPFDSGAHKKGLFPSYINMIDTEHFDVSDINQAPEKLIGSFFVTPERYFKLQSREASTFDTLFNVTTLDEEVKALQNLILSKDGNYDDRRFSIEIQTNDAVHVNNGTLQAVIFPEEYFDDPKFAELLSTTGATAIPYESFPLRQDYYYYAIYQKLFEYYRRMNLIR